MRLFIVLLIATAAFASASFAESNLERMREVITKRYPNLSIDHLATTPVAGIYQLGVRKPGAVPL